MNNNLSYAILTLLAGFFLILFLLYRQKKTERSLHSAKLQIRLMEAWTPQSIAPLSQPVQMRLPN